MNRMKQSFLATGLVLALFLLPSATAAFAQTSTVTSTYATFRVTNAHGIVQSGVKSVLEINDHVYTKYTDVNGMVSFNLAGYSSAAHLQVDFEKGTLGATKLSTVGQVIGKTFAITLVA